MVPKLLFFRGVLPGWEDGIEDVLCVGVGDVLCVGFILSRWDENFILFFAGGGDENGVGILDEALRLVEVSLGLGAHSCNF